MVRQPFILGRDVWSIDCAELYEFSSTGPTDILHQLYKLTGWICDAARELHFAGDTVDSDLCAMGLVGVMGELGEATLLERAQPLAEVHI